MKVVVAVKPVADLDEEFEIGSDNQVEPDYLEWDLNEWDSFSLEEASKLAGGEQDEVISLSIGGQNAVEVLRMCLARGADRAVRITHDSLADLDALAAARMLAVAIGKEDPDLILFGVQSSDGASGATGAATAALLDLPCVAVVRSVSLDSADGSVLVERELEGGAVELLKVPCPALLTVQTGINEPRYATLRAIKQAEQEPIEELDPESLGFGDGGIDAARGSRLTRLASPEAGGAEMLAGEPESIAFSVAEIVRERLRS